MISPWIESKRGFNFKIISGYVAATEIDKQTLSFHASTIKEALEGLKKKTKKAMKNIVAIDTVIGVKRFREITGACETGCKNFMSLAALKEIKVAVIGGPLSIFIHPDQSSYDLSLLDSVDAVFFYVKYLNHSIYYRTIDYLKGKAKKIYYLNQQNESLALQEIWRKMR